MILAILQARSTSTRLPGKVLEDVLGLPMIIRQIERLKSSSQIDLLVVATSDDPSDDALVNILNEEGVLVRRGPLDDVLERFSQVVDEFEPSSIVRLTADCPLTDINVIDMVISSHLETNSDYTSNTLEPTFPDGLDVECVSISAFNLLRTLDLSTSEREHVTLGIYKRPNIFQLNSIVQPTDLSSLRWTVDVPDDLTFVRTIYELLYARNPSFGQKEILDLFAEEPTLSRTDEEFSRNFGLNK